jgi:hypothetical protein
MVVTRAALLVRRMSISEPKRLRFFETFVVKFRLFLSGEKSPMERERKKIGERT